MLKCSIKKNKSRSNYINLYRAKKTNAGTNGLLSSLPLAAAVLHWQEKSRSFSVSVQASHTPSCASVRALYCFTIIVRVVQLLFRVARGTIIVRVVQLLFRVACRTILFSRHASDLVTHRPSSIETGAIGASPDVE